MDTNVDTFTIPLSDVTLAAERRCPDEHAAATAFAYRLALSQERTECDALAAAGRAYLKAGGDPTRADCDVREITAAEWRRRSLWFKRPLRPRIAGLPG